LSVGHWSHRECADLGAVHGRSHFVGRTAIGGKLDHVVVDISEVSSGLV
jgi:hypothetical protein